MDNIEEVNPYGDGRSHWRARGPLGLPAEWDAEITRDLPGRQIAWQSIESSDGNVKTEGCVDFDGQGGSTRVHVTLGYEAPGGLVGDLAATIFANPERQLEEDLLRFRDGIESNAGYSRSTQKIIGDNAGPGISNTVDVGGVRPTYTSTPRKER
jgi:uncharacterized membrane protein